jgi:hypothetical protein
MKRTRRHDARSAVAILEEAVHLLRTAPPALAPYYIGSLPFILGLLYFWTDMSTGASAWQHCSQAAWGLVLLFIWMKTWQSVYARRLLATIRGEEPPAWGARRILSAVCIQTAIQPWSIIVLPVAFIIMIPFPQALAFFQNTLLIGSGDEHDMQVILRKSWRQASLWPMQNALVIWLTSPFLLVIAALLLFVLVPVSALFNPAASTSLLFFGALVAVIPLCPLGVIIALNAGATLLLVPWLLKTLLDIETVFSMSSTHILNDTFLAIVCSVTFLCLDPLIKASYCLRCFYGESLQTGEDLKVKLRSPSRTGVATVLFLALLLASGSFACGRAEPRSTPIANHESHIKAGELDSAIERVIGHPEYAWRMPREKPPEASPGHGAFREFVGSIWLVLKNAVKYIVKGLVKAWHFVRDILSRVSPSLPEVDRPDTGWTSFSRALIVLPIVCITAVLAFLAWRAWRDRKPAAPGAAVITAPAPDISRDDVDASLLPEDGWLALAGELIGKGELRLALRALYLATLSCLAGQKLITITMYKSDREYELELRRRSHAKPLLVALFAENRTLFESAWYGLHEVTPGIMERFSRNQELIRTDAQS